MHPGFISWWQQRHGASGHESTVASGPHWGCGHHHHTENSDYWSASAVEDGGGFGVRRPLRFLAHKLELTEEQVAKVAVVLNTLKTERAQAEVDQRRRIATIAEAIEGSVFDADKLESAGQVQVATAERLKSAITAALRELHTVLDDTQRKKLAYLLRTGVLSL